MGKYSFLPSPHDRSSELQYSLKREEPVYLKWMPRHRLFSCFSTAYLGWTTRYEHSRRPKSVQNNAVFQIYNWTSPRFEAKADALLLIVHTNRTLLRPYLPRRLAHSYHPHHVIHVTAISNRQLSMLILTLILIMWCCFSRLLINFRASCEISLRNF